MGNRRCGNWGTTDTCQSINIYLSWKHCSVDHLPLPPLILGHWMAQRIATVSDSSGSIQPQWRTKMAERREGPRETRVQLCLSENRCICSCRIRYAQIIIKKKPARNIFPVLTMANWSMSSLFHSCEKKSLASLNFCLEGGGVSKTGRASEAIVGFKN